MPGQNQVSASLQSFVAKVALTKGQAVVLVIATEDQVDLPAAANSALFIGFAANDAAINETVAIHTVGGVAQGKVGATIALGDFVMINGTSGDLKPVVLGASNQYCVGKALRGGAAGDLIPVLVLNFIAQGA